MLSRIFFFAFLLVCSASSARTKKDEKMIVPEQRLIRLINLTLDSLERTRGEDPHVWVYIDYANFPDCSREKKSGQCRNCKSTSRTKTGIRGVNVLIDRGYFKDILVYLESYSARDRTILHYRILHFVFEYLPDSLPSYRYDFVGVYTHVIVKTDGNGDKLDAVCHGESAAEKFALRFREVFDRIKFIH
jgi:hypothetical protein